MRILVATGIYPPDIGGPATYSKLLREELPSRGIEVKILSFGEVRYLPKLIRHVVYFCKAAVRSRGCDVIFAQDPVSVGLPALCAARLARKRFFIRVAGDYAWEQASQRYGINDTIDEFQKKKYGLKTEFLRSVERFVVRHADKVITPSIYFRDLVSGWNGGRKKIIHIYNGIEFPHLSASRSDTRMSLRIASDAKVIVSAGRLVPWKGFFKLIDVLQSLHKEDSAWRLFIIGTGPDKEALQKHIYDCGLQESVTITGAISREAVFSYLVAADIFVLNTSFESFSFQIVEAMYAGIPIVSTNIGNISELVTDEKEAILVKPDDAAALEQAILKLTNDLGLRTRIVAAAAEKAKAFSISNTLDQLVELFNQE